MLVATIQQIELVLHIHTYTLFEKFFPYRSGFDPCIRKIPWRRKGQPTPVLLPGESHGGRSLVGYSPWCRKELDTTERLHYITSYISTSWSEYMLILSENIYSKTKYRYFGKQSDECTWKVFGLLIVIYRRVFFSHPFVQIIKNLRVLLLKLTYYKPK